MGVGQGRGQPRYRAKQKKKEKIEGRVESMHCFKHVEFEVVVQRVQQTVANMGLASREEVQDGKKDFIIIDMDGG